ncbi:general stress protein [Paenibacillus filicis]|uniref:General stress protein n=1 Tax=Paenibacillus filicis TaxID=669464 RepID=A0ABU9DW94_9BACL
MGKQIVGVFNHEDEAVRVIEQLKSDGYHSEHISIIGRDPEELETIGQDTGSHVETGAVTGAATGGMVGGVTGLLAGIGALAIPAIGPILAAGPIAATLAGAALGAGAGGIVGSLIGLGIPEDEARTYDDYIRQGKILVLVESDDLHDPRAIETFRANHSLNASKLPAADNASIPSNPVERAREQTKDVTRAAIKSTRSTESHLEEPTDYGRDGSPEEGPSPRRY